MKHGNVLPLKMALTGIGLSLSFVIASHYFSGENRLQIFALFLALTSCVYGGAILTPAGAEYSLVELPFVVVVFVFSILGLLLSPLYIAFGYFIHGIWDLGHHFGRVKTPIVKWFPPLCASFDFLMCLFIFWLWFAGN